MGFKTFGFGGGREDIWEPEEDIYWGSESKWLDDKRYSGDRDLENPLAAVQMGLIYVNPEGPNGNPDPLASARDIRETFARMAMNDEETVALIAGGHTFGKTHGAGPAAPRRPRPGSRRPRRTRPRLEEQLRHRQRRRHHHQRPRSHLDHHAHPVEQQLLRKPLRLRMGTHQKPRRRPPVAAEKRRGRRHRAPRPRRDQAHRAQPCSPPTSRCASIPPTKKSHAASSRIPDQFADAFARAWFKLTHRDMGPRARYLGPEVPAEELIWQDPIPAVDHPLIDAQDIAALKGKILASGLTVSELVSTAWASASTFRGSDKRGGANGARIRLAPQKDLGSQPARPTRQSARHARRHPERVQQHRSPAGKKSPSPTSSCSAGCAGVEQAAKNAGHAVTVPFTPGRMDASQEQTDVDSFAVPRTDRRRLPQLPQDDSYTVPAEELLIDKAQLLTLTAPEMTVLVGGLRVLERQRRRIPARRLHQATRKP